MLGSQCYASGRSECLHFRKHTKTTQKALWFPGPGRLFTHLVFFELHGGADEAVPDVLRQELAHAVHLKRHERVRGDQTRELPTVRRDGRGLPKHRTVDFEQRQLAPRGAGLDGRPIVALPHLRGHALVFEGNTPNSKGQASCLCRALWI